MASIAQEHLVRLRIGLSIGGNQLSIDLNYANNSFTTGTEARTFIDDWITANLSALEAALSSEVKIDYISAYPIKAGQFLGFTKYLSGHVGALGTEALPSNVGAILQFRQTEVSGKHNGRICLPGVPEDKTTDGLITTGYQTTELAGLATALQTPVSSGGDTYSLCVVQRFESGIAIVPVAYLVTLVQPMRNMGTQRRRTTELREFHP